MRSGTLWRDVLMSAAAYVIWIRASEMPTLNIRCPKMNHECLILRAKNSLTTYKRMV